MWLQLQDTEELKSMSKIQEAFKNKRIYYSDKPAYHEFKISKLKME